MNIKISGATVAATANLYAAGMLVGAKLTLTDVSRPSARNPVLVGVTTQDLTKQSSALYLVLFDANPAATTFTNNAALDIADADLPKVAGIVTIAAGDYVALNDNSVAYSSCTVPLWAASGETMYACVVCNGAPTYAANELSLVLHVIDN